jgi:hypothetical protein
MAPTGSDGSLASVLTLSRTRKLIRNAMGRGLAISIALVYGFISLVVGLMLIFGPTGVTSTQVEVITNPYVLQWWNYPAVLVIAPGGVLELPFFDTVSTVLVSMGVGIGMSAGIMLALRIVRQRRQAPSGAGAATTLASLTPAMVALLTLGACCSTTAAAAAGIGAVAQASGTTYSQLLLNSWYLNVFQLAVLALALLAQEQLLRVYGGVFGLGDGSGVPGQARPSPSRRTPWPRGILRTLLLVAGALWSLSFLIELATPAPGVPFSGIVIGGILQRPLVGLTAVAVAFVPGGLLTLSSRRSLRGWTLAYRVLLFACGFSLAVGVPPPLAGWGASGLVNQAMGAAGVPGSLGGVPPSMGGSELLISWVAFLAFLGIFAMWFSLRPGPLLRRLAGPEAPSGAPPAPSFATGVGTLSPREASRSAAPTGGSLSDVPRV